MRRHSRIHLLTPEDLTKKNASRDYFFLGPGGPRFWVRKTGQRPTFWAQRPFSGPENQDHKIVQNVDPRSPKRTRDRLGGFKIIIAESFRFKPAHRLRWHRSSGGLLETLRFSLENG